MRNAFQALGEFPRADTRELRDRCDRALDRCKQSIAREHARDAERSWRNLFEATNHVRAYELTLAQQSAPEQLVALKEAAETYIASVPRWPRNGLDVIKQKLASGRSADLAANEVALKTLCVRAEILAGLPTPTDDLPLRRDYQLQRLVQSNGKGPGADESTLDGLAIEWVSVGPVEDATYVVLQQRFLGCRNNSVVRDR